MSFNAEKILHNSGGPFYKGNRDEHYLVEAGGLVVPDVDLIFYGLLNSPLIAQFPQIREVGGMTPKEIYYRYGFYSREDLLRTLREMDPDDDFKEVVGMSMYAVFEEAIKRFPATGMNEVLLWHGILETATFDFLQTLTIVFDYNVGLNPKIVDYIYKSAPPSARSKIKILIGETEDVILGQDNPYTTIFSSSYDLILKILRDPKKYNAETAFMLLRNHSENTKMIHTDGSEELSFNEEGNAELARAVIDPATKKIISYAGYARYEAKLVGMAPKLKFDQSM